MVLLIDTAAPDGYDLNLPATPIFAVWAVLALSPAPCLGRLVGDVATATAAGLLVVAGEAGVLLASVLLAGVAVTGVVLVTPHANDLRPPRRPARGDRGLGRS